MQKVCIQGSRRLRKSAYTRRTPKPPPPRAKSVHTSLPRVLYKKYAYKADAIRQKVHTLAGHPPAVLPAKSMHTRLPPMPQTPPPLPGRLNPAERLSRGFWPASPLFSAFFLRLSFGFVGRGAAVCPVLVHTLPAAAGFAGSRCILF